MTAMGSKLKGQQGTLNGQQRKLTIKPLKRGSSRLHISMHKCSPGN